MKLKLKLKSSELPALTGVLEEMILKNDPTGVDSNEVIVSLLMLKMYKKLKEKCALIDKKNYSIGIEPEQALAFIQWFQGVQIPVTTFAGNVTRRVLSEFYRSTTNLIT